MTPFRFSGHFKGKDVKNRDAKVDIDLSVINFNEDDVYFIYSPALDITGYGYNEEEAKSSFYVSINEFLSYTLHKGTFLRELERMGWKILGKRKINYVQPDINELAKSNEYLQDILQHKQFSEKNTSIQLPVFA